VRREIQERSAGTTEAVHHPPALQHHMADRAGSQRTLTIEGASHAISVSRPDATVQAILEATALRTAA
jgi:pimeloyl-ACP methyl ester carboxylesterase